jgi:hypothetical protein
MGTVVLHAGRPKTGSSSVQVWIQRHQRLLRSRRIRPVVAEPGSRTRVRPYRSGSVSSIGFVRAYHERGCPRAMVEQLVHDLDDLAGDGTVLLTAENLAGLLAGPDETLARSLVELSARHRVRVAYYVRPQDSALEAAWCQWGFRLRERTPSEFVTRAAREYHYLQIVRDGRAAMPGVELVVRPFRRDLLLGGNVVEDFAATFLAMPSAPDREVWANPGLPIAAANLLHDLDGAHIPFVDDGDLGVLKRHLRDWQSDETELAQRARAVLRRYCHDRFEDDNRALIRTEGWPTDHFISFIPSAVPDTSPLDIGELDRLWAPSASPAERALFAVVLSALMQHDDARRRASARAPWRAFRTAKHRVGALIGPDLRNRIAAVRKHR